jgi:hypothetical protein
MRIGNRLERGIFLRILEDMDSATRGAGEPRKAMMAVAKVSWEDCDETVLTAPAKIEDTSPSGACLRLKVPIEAGTKIHVSRCRDDFSGTAKWCRADEGEYVVGMRRGQVARPTPLSTAPQLNAVNPRPMETTSIVRADARRVREVEARNERPTNDGGVREASGLRGHEMDAPVEPAHIPETVQNNSSQRPPIRRGTLIPIPKPAPLQLARVTFPPAVMHEPMIGFEIARDNAPRRMAASEPTKSSMQYQERTTSFFEESTDMQNKWLNLGNRR